MDWLFFIKDRENNHTEQRVTSEVQQLIAEIEKAKNDWIQSQIVFDWADDPEYVDYAIYAMEAAERRYMYLLNKAKRMAIFAQ